MSNKLTATAVLSTLVLGVAFSVPASATYQGPAAPGGGYCIGDPALSRKFDGSMVIYKATFTNKCGETYYLLVLDSTGTERRHELPPYGTAVSECHGYVAGGGCVGFNGWRVEGY